MTERHPPSRDPSWSRPRGMFGVGEMIAGRYEVTRFIARGGIGEVYEVIDQQLGERLALKTLQAHEALDDVARERFRREIQLARRVTHRNVCRLYDAGTYDDGPHDDGLYDAGPAAGPAGEGSPHLFCTMELLDGETLHDHVVERGPLPTSEVLAILRQMVAGLEAAHAQGIIHRDFKSSNVMLEPTAGKHTHADLPADQAWRVVVTDFGLARPLSDDDPAMFRTDRSFGVTGTLAFMAPEQLEEGAASISTDIYALGVVLYHMLTGQMPFGSKTSIGTAVRRLREAPPSPRDEVPSLDRRWEAAVLRCLEVDPADRFQSASQVLEAVAGRDPTGLPSRRRRWLRRAGSAMAALLPLALLALWWGLREPASWTPVADDPVQLTTDPGLEIDPAFSPDGQTLVFSADRGGGFELWSRPFAPGAKARKLTDDGGRNVQPTWSPNGAFLGYVSLDRGGIWTMPAAGGTARRITDFGSRPSWSPDGERLAFQSDERKDVSERTLAAMPPSTLWSVRIDPMTGSAVGEPQRLTRPGEPTGGHGEPSWSPDGKRLAFSSGNRRRTQIWTVGLDGERLEALLSEARVNINPLYTADGRSLIYIGISSRGRQSASYAVWLQPLDPDSGMASGEPRRLTRLGIATIRQVALSPADDRLVYAALSTVSSLYELELDGASEPVGASTLFVGSGQRNSRPAFSPDGRLVAFDRWQIGTNLDLWLREADGPPQQVTIDPEWDSQPVFLPDGQAIAYFSERQGRRGLWRLDLDTGEIGFLADIGVDADWARLSPDGTRIAYHSSRDSASLDVWIHDLETGTDHRLTRDPELAGFPIWSPDGRRLAIEIRRQGSTQVAVLPSPGSSGPGGAGGGSPGAETLRQLTFEAGESWPYSWSPDGQKIAFAGRRDGVWNLFWVDRESGEVRRLTDEAQPDGYVRYPAWSPDGRRLIYERARTVGDLWRVDLGPPE